MNPEQSNAAAIGRFYDEYATVFEKVYGEIIQSFRTTNMAELLRCMAASMELKAGTRALDAGCGVCGPAIFFAQYYGVQVDALTASAGQVKIAGEKIKNAGLEDKITVKQGDFHFPEQYYPAGEYDLVYFLESFGHSPNHEALIAAAWNMLKPGGKLYIKDLFVKEAVVQQHVPEIESNISKINSAYHYSVLDLYDILRYTRRKGFILSFVRTVNIPLDQFENLTISNDFQDITGINRVDSYSNYVFPIDFFELCCIKPWYHLENGSNSYFLQNLYNMQVNGIAEQDL